MEGKNGKIMRGDGKEGGSSPAKIKHTYAPHLWREGGAIFLMRLVRVFTEKIDLR
jgi:hypothetical protein